MGLKLSVSLGVRVRMFGSSSRWAMTIGEYELRELASLVRHVRASPRLLGPGLAKSSWRAGVQLLERAKTSAALRSNGSASAEAFGSAPAELRSARAYAAQLRANSRP